MTVTVRRGARALLTLIGEAACRAVLVRLRAVAATGTGPVIDVLDLLVLHDTAH